MNKILTFKISIPTQDGFLGRECNNTDCKRYFKIHQDSEKNEIYCPYCGLVFNINELTTQDQLKYAQEKAMEEARAYACNRVNNILSEAFGKHVKSNRKSMVNVTWSHKPASPYPRKYIAAPTEKKVDSEIECSQCKAKFQVYGIFGYCPICKCDNILIYNTNISILLKEIENANDKNRALRYAYNDLVSTFEIFCKKRNKTQKKYNFQNIDSTERFFVDTCGKKLFDSLTGDEALIIKRLFQKRHVYQHNKGIIDQKYIETIPKDVSFLGQIAPLAIEEFRDATAVMRKILLKII